MSRVRDMHISLNTHALRWVLIAGIVAGTLDILFATGFWALRGVAPQRVLQAVAAGLLGKGSFGGGHATALLGLALHYLIALAMAAGYAWAARGWPWLRSGAWTRGALYGVALYLLMNHVVVPLSAAPSGGMKGLAWLTGTLLAHVVLVGIPIAWCTQRAYRDAERRDALAGALPD